MVWGEGGVGYYAAISMWRWYLHVFVVSYVSLGRSPYRLAFIEDCTGVSLCTFVVFGGSPRERDGDHDSRGLGNPKKKYFC